jgi:hypothetical protein
MVELDKKMPREASPQREQRAVKHVPPPQRVTAIESPVELPRRVEGTQNRSFR